MESKFIIYVVFATLSQTSLVSSSTVYGLTVEQTSVLLSMDDHQEKAHLVATEIFSPIIDFVASLACNLTQGLKAQTTTRSTKFNAAIIGVQDLVDEIVATITIFNGEKYSVTDATKEGVTSLYTQIYGQFTAAMDVAISGKDTDGAIETNMALTQESFKQLVSGFYDLISNGVNATDEDSVNIIQAARNVTLRTHAEATTATYNAMTAYMNAVASGNHCTLVSVIASYQSVVKLAIVSGTRAGWVAFKAVFLKNNLNLSGIGSELFEIERAQAASSDYLKMGSHGIFNSIDAYSRGIAHGLEVPAGAQIDDEESQSLAGVMRGIAVVENSVLTVDGALSSTADEAARKVQIMTQSGIKRFYHAIRLTKNAGHSCTKDKKQIETERTEVLALISHYVDALVNLIFNGNCYDNAANKIATIEHSIKEALTDFVNDVFNAIETLFKHHSVQHTATSRDSADVKDCSRSQANSDIDTLTHDTAYLRIIKLTADKVKVGRN